MVVALATMVGFADGSDFVARVGALRRDLGNKMENKNKWRLLKLGDLFRVGRGYVQRM